MKNPRCTPRPARSWFASDRKSTRLNSSHSQISYAVFCLKKNKDKLVVERHPVQLRLVQHVCHLLDRRPSINPEPLLAVLLRVRLSRVTVHALTRVLVIMI